MAAFVTPGTRLTLSSACSKKRPVAPSGSNRCPVAWICIVSTFDEAKPTCTAKSRSTLRKSRPELTSNTKAIATSLLTSTARV